MEFSERIIISILGAVAGFVLSQFFNVIKFFRRPKFEAMNSGNGVLSAYTGNPPETPAEVVIGFYLRNCGRRPAKNTRVFISDLQSGIDNKSQLEEGVFEVSELTKPLDIIPPGEAVPITVGKISSADQYLSIPFEGKKDGERISCVEADTRGKKIFTAKFRVYCDDIDPFSEFDLKFQPAEYEWASAVFQEY